MKKRIACLLVLTMVLSCLTDLSLLQAEDGKKLFLGNEPESHDAYGVQDVCELYIINYV